jgi:uncharacterized protein YoaH (UPF0181 family)
MSSSMPALSHLQQQQATDRIHQLMAEGMSSGEAIALVASEIRKQPGYAQSLAVFDEDDEQE